MTDVNEYFLIPPDWANPVLLRKQWRTGMQRTIVDGEKRSALFTWPRRALAYDAVAMEYSETAYIKRKIFKNLHNVWGIPYWQDRTALAAEAASGQAVLDVVSTQYRNFEIGALCILLASKDSFEIGTIQSFTANQITLDANLTGTWPAGMEVYPVLKCRIKSGQKFNFLTTRAGKIKIEAREDYDEITRHIPNINDFPTYLGSPIFNIPPDWSYPVNTTFLRDHEVLSFLGKQYSASHWDETAFRFDAGYMADGKAEIQRFLDFFDAHKGRWGKFWRASWTADIVITAPFAADAVQLTINPIEYPDYWLGKKTGSHIILLWPDDDFICLGVTGATINTIDVDQPVGRACNAEQLSQLKVSFLTLCRFSQDEVEAKYLTDSVATIDLSCRAV